MVGRAGNGRNVGSTRPCDWPYPVRTPTVVSSRGRRRVIAPLAGRQSSCRGRRRGIVPLAEGKSGCEGRRRVIAPLAKVVLPLSGGRGRISGGVPGTPSVALKRFWGGVGVPGTGLQSGPGPPRCPKSRWGKGKSCCRGRRRATAPLTGGRNSCRVPVRVREKQLPGAGAGAGSSGSYLMVTRVAPMGPMV